MSDRTIVDRDPSSNKCVMYYDGFICNIRPATEPVKDPVHVRRELDARTMKPRPETVITPANHFDVHLLLTLLRRFESFD